MSKYRKLISQLCAIFPYSCLHFANGVFTSYVVILIAELHRKDSEIFTTLDQLSWFAGLEIIKPVGTLVTGLLTHRWGCRPLAFTASFLFIASGLMYYYSTTVTIIFAGRLLSSLFSVTPLANPYISEISEPQLRSHFFMVAHLSGVIGSFFTLLLGSLMYWRTIAVVNLIFPVLAAVTVFATPHSPIWLASKGRLEEAERSLCWLRGWVKREQVQNEFCALVDGLKKSNPGENKNDIEALTWREQSRNFFKLFIERSFYVPLGTMCLIFLVYSFNGVTTTDTYSTVIFRELNSPIEESVATAITGAMGIVGSLVILLFVRRVGKRNLIFFSVVATGLCHAAVALIGFLELKGRYLWIPPIAVIMSKFANAAGIGAVVYMLPAEIFPSSVRYIGSSISQSVRTIMSSVIKKLFLYIVQAATLSGVFLFFGVLNLVALATYYFLVPETEGRSLKEIEDEFKDAQTLDERKK